MHILITGEVGVGKSTLINKLLERTNQTIHGFVATISKKHSRNHLFSLFYYAIIIKRPK